jgi:hypothetical protein
MSKQRPHHGERVEKAEIIVELPSSPHGTHSYEQPDGTVVHGDLSGEWPLDEDGEVEDIVFFVSPVVCEATPSPTSGRTAGAEEGDLRLTDTRWLGAARPRPTDSDRGSSVTPAKRSSDEQRATLPRGRSAPALRDLLEPPRER